MEVRRSLKHMPAEGALRVACTLLAAALEVSDVGVEELLERRALRAFLASSDLPGRSVFIADLEATL